MKRKTILVFVVAVPALIAVILVARFIWPFAGRQKSGNLPDMGNAYKVIDVSFLSMRILDHEMTIRREPPVDLKALGIDMEFYREATEDHGLIQILATYPKSPVGKLVRLPPNEVSLEIGDGRTFRASQIGDVRTRADDGTVAIDAITVPDGVPIKSIDVDDDGIGISGNPSEIWINPPAGAAIRISPPDFHCAHPVISPDGKHIAFTAQSIANGHLHPKVLVIRNTVSGEVSSYAVRRHGWDYQIRAVDWVEGSRVLRVIDDWGETGGHMLLKQIRVR